MPNADDRTDFFSRPLSGQSCVKRHGYSADGIIVKLQYMFRR